MKRICLTLLLLAIPLVSAAKNNPVDGYFGVNGIFFNHAQPWNADLEGVGGLAISASPHISAVGSVEYGFSHAYFRGTGGVRITATDVENKDFSIGLGVQYHTASVAGLRPDEWCPDVAVGVRPWPQKYPSLTLTALGWYGVTTNKAAATLGARWRFNLY